MHVERKIAALVALAIFSAGCNQRPEEPEPVKPSPQTLPFNQTAAQKGKSPTVALDIIPAGTAIRVRLQAPLSSITARTGDAFTAVLDQSLILDGQLLFPRGAAITGRVLEAKPWGAVSGPGYLRLTLTQIILNGKSLKLETSSFFAKGEENKTPTGAPLMTAVSRSTNVTRPLPSSTRDIKLPPQQPLTFRLAAGLELPG